MPYFDLNITSEITGKKYDFTIIGAGAAGILIALKLAEQGFKVNLIESGHFTEDEQRQRLNDLVQKGKFLSTATEGRKRAVGGTTIAWGGQSLPFSKIDFENREWLENKGWPISFEEVSCYYDEANKFMGIDNEGYTDRMLKKLGLMKFKPQSDELIYHVSKWARTPNFAILHNKALTKNIDVYYNAHLIGVQKDESKVSGIEVANFHKKRFRLAVKNIIIASGGLESVRILQLNELSKSDLLGKGFMEHPSIEFGEVKNYKPYHLQRIFNTHFINRRKYSLRLSLSENHQRSKKILNASVTVMFDYPESASNPYKQAKSAIKKFDVASLLATLKGSTYLISTLCSYIVHGFLFKPKSVAKLSMMLEQEPMSTSRTYLSDELDQFGLQKTVLDWKISDLTWRTFLEVSLCTKNLLENNNLGEVSIYPHLHKDTPNFNTYFSGVNHHMGGAVIGDHQEESVVDKNLMLWGYGNAYVCSSAVFPTGSHSNPTLTLLALSCRLVDHLSTTSNKSN
jgi:choline dehydrogenase-like flavoprotein